MAEVVSASLHSLSSLPDNILLEIITYLPVHCLGRLACVSQRFHKIVQDDMIWKRMFYKQYKVVAPLPPGAVSWHSEYQRLSDQAPVVLCQVLRGHRAEVLHVSFSHSGHMFATSSKDGIVMVWKVDIPCSLQLSVNTVQRLHWVYTVFSQFSMSDTKLLVSGYHSSSFSAFGQLAVFDLQSLELVSLVENDPLDLYGAWYDDNHFLSGTIQQTGNDTSVSSIWLNKVSGISSLKTAGMASCLYHFQNVSSGCIRTMLLADCSSPQLSLLTPAECDPSRHTAGVHYQSQNGADQFFSYTSCAPEGGETFDRDSLSEHRVGASGCWGDYKSDSVESGCDKGWPLTLEGEFCDTTLGMGFEKKSNDHSSGGQQAALVPKFALSSMQSLSCEHVESFESASDWKQTGRTSAMQISTHEGKLLVCSMSLDTYAPHVIGIKRLQMEKIKDSMSAGDAWVERSDGAQYQPDMNDDVAINHQIDAMDHMINVHGRVVGMALSPDHRFLFFNIRKWPKEYVITDVMEPPPLSKNMEVRVLDLDSLQEVGFVFSSHKAFSPNHQCFFVFLDVSKHYVASGAENNQGYLWDRHYNIFLGSFLHSDVVSCVAFHPHNEEMLVTVGDDFQIKVWRSRRAVRQKAN